MSFEVEGKLYKKFDTQQITDTFKKREFIVEIDGAYPQLVAFQLMQDRCNLIDAYSEQDQLKIYFDLRGREWKSPQGEYKYFNTLNAWKIENAQQSQESGPPVTDDSFPSEEDALPFEDSTDDLPF